MRPLAAPRPSALDPSPWRPQRAGLGRAREVRDPVVEPLWAGFRVLVFVRPGSLEIVDEDGDPLDVAADLPAAIMQAALADELVLDGYLTAQPGRSSEGLIVGTVPPPTSGEALRQMVIGGAAERPAQRRSLGARSGDALSLVAVDLLAIDGQFLLDVPLLERKRILESALAESERVRCGMYVRPPVETWFGSWRAMGFSETIWKEANGRYRPGERNAGWAIAAIPRR